jgi:hypothetical protein
MPAMNAGVSAALTVERSVGPPVSLRRPGSRVLRAQ